MASETVTPSQTLRLADHFPLVSKQCQKQASTFFKCFSTKGEQPPEGVSSNALMMAKTFTPAISAVEMM